MTTPRWLFGPFCLDMASGCLWRDDVLVPLRPKPFALLAYLVMHAGQVVAKDTLLHEVWPEAVVSAGVLKDCINQIRRTLGDTAQNPRYVATVHRRGYRFVAPVTVHPPQLSPVQRPPMADEEDLSLGAGTLRTPALVARQGELGQIQTWWTLAQQGQRQLGFISGEAGIGKSTLVDAVAAQISSDQALWISYGQCIEHYGAGEAYLPLLEACGRLGRGPDGSLLIEILQQYAPSWLAHLPALTSSAGPEGSQEYRAVGTQERMLRELAEAVEVLSSRVPLILILEDLHWSDTATLDWLGYVARRREPARLLILGTYRPLETLDRGHPLRRVVLELKRHQQCHELVLGYWSPAGVAEYLQQRFQGKSCPPEVVHLLYQRTQGSPLFLVTVLDDMLRRGVLREKGAGLILVDGGEGVEVDVPESLRHLIELQIEQLEPPDQELLKIASVAGMVFSTASVAFDTDLSVEEVEQRCATLARHQRFIQSCGTTTWPDGTLTAQYGFRHAFYREVLYERVPLTRRIQLHRQLGLRLEASYGSQTPEVAAELALHFVQGRDDQRARRYLRQAAHNALRRSAHREAAQYYERALQTLQPLPSERHMREQVVDLTLELRNALVPLGEFDRILTYLREAETLARELDDTLRQGRIAAYLTRDLHMIGNHAEAVATGERALTIVQDELALRVATHLYLSYAYYALGDYRRAVELLRPEVETLSGAMAGESLGLAALPAVSTRASLARQLTELGEFPEAKRLAFEALQIAEAAGHPFSLTQAYRGLGGLHLQQGGFEQAVLLLKRGLALCRDADLPLAFPPVASALGTAYIWVGRLKEALPLLEQAVEAATSMRLDDRQTERMILLGQGYLHADRLGDAMSLVQEALMQARQRRERGVEAQALNLLGAMSAGGASPDLTQAEAYYRHAITLASDLGMRPLLAHSTQGLGLVYQQSGQRHRAAAMLSTAAALFKTMGMTYWLAQAQAALADRHIEIR